MNKPRSFFKMPQSLDNIISPLVTPVVRRRGLAQADIILEWEKIVREMAEYCVPIKLSFIYGKTTEGTLHLWVDSGAVLKLEYAKDLIISCINGYFGYKAVAFLKFQQTSLNLLKIKQIKKPQPIIQKPITSTLSCSAHEVGSDRLHSALKSLGTAMGCEIVDH